MKIVIIIGLSEDLSRDGDSKEHTYQQNIFKSRAHYFRYSLNKELGQFLISATILKTFIYSKDTLLCNLFHFTEPEIINAEQTFLTQRCIYIVHKRVVQKLLKQFIFVLRKRD